MPDTFYPYPKVLKRDNMANFGLWYQKRVPVNNDFKASADKSGKHEGAVDYYAGKYENTIKQFKIGDLLVTKHLAQITFIKTMKKSGYKSIVFTATLVSPLVIGIGQTHPSETSLTLDRNLGIPYIPASTLKGNVRLARIVDWIENNPQSVEGKNSIDEETEVTDLPKLFGTQKHRGQVVFLDAYPVTVPKLHLDIINPHYGEYYSEGKAPADYLEPKPIKFLTVKEKTEFVFRVLLSPDPDSDKLLEILRKVLKNALEEGIGAKNAIGYGHFEVKEEESDELKKIMQKRLKEKKEAEENKKLESMSEDDRMLNTIEHLENDTEEIAKVCKKLQEKQYPSSVFKALKEKLQKLDQWKLSGSKKKKTKMNKRNSDIESRIE